MKMVHWDTLQENEMECATDDGSTRMRHEDGATFLYVRADLLAAPALACHAALDDRFPDDWVYEQMSCIADNLCDRDVEDRDKADEAMDEIADSLVDVYNADRVKWLASHLDNAALCDDAAKEFGWEQDRGIFGLIGMGQYLAIERIGNALIECVQTEAEDREHSSEDDEV
jgi:hypothetical protein